MNIYICIYAVSAARIVCIYYNMHIFIMDDKKNSFKIAFGHS